MNKIRIVAKNTSVLLLAQVLSYIFGFFATIYMARYLGAGDFGVISLAIAISGIFGLVADLGLNSLIVREVARDESFSNKYISAIGLIKFILAFITFGLITILVCWIGYPFEVIQTIYIITFSVILGSFSGIFYSVFQANEKMEYQSMGIILASVLQLIGVILAITLSFNVIGFAFIYLAVNIFILIYILVMYYRKFFFKIVSIDSRFIKSTIKMAWPLSLSTIFAAISFRIDTLILSIMKGVLIVGYYSAAYRLMEILMFLPLVFTTSLYPVLSKFHVSSKESLKFTYIKSFKYLVILGLPIAVGITLTADKIIILIYDIGFYPSVIILQILVWAIPLSFLTQIFGIILISINKQHLLLKIIFLCMCFNVILNVLIIPNFSSIGASIVTVLTELLLLVLSFHYLSRYVIKINIFEMLMKPIISCIMLTFYIVLTLEYNIIIIGLGSVIVYIISLILLKTFSREDINMFMQIFGFKRDL